MSGPKLMHVTTSPLALLLNEAVFIAVGKVAYFSPQIDGVNKDIENEITWFENYCDQIQEINLGDGGGGGDAALQNAVGRIKKIRTKYTSEMQRSIVSKDVLERMEPAEINNLLVGIVRMLPVKKEAFLREISEALESFDVARKRAEAAALARQRELEKIAAKKREEQKAKERAAYNRNEQAYKAEEEQYRLSLQEGIEIQRTGDGWGQIDYSAIDQFVESDEEPDEPVSPFPDLSEQIKIEMIKGDLQSVLGIEGTEIEEKDLIEKLMSDLDSLEANNDFYSDSSKRVILNRLEMNYNEFNKRMAQKKIKEAERMKERGSLEAEYITYTNALEMIARDISSMSLETLAEETEALRLMMLERTRMEYMEESIIEIMQNKGYSSVSANSLSDDDGISSMIFENDQNMNIRTSLNDDMIMIEVVGNGENAPTPSEIQQIVSNQGELCRIYPEIKSELEQKGIHVESEICTPVSAETAKNIPITVPRDRRKKKYGFTKLASSVPSGKEDVQRFLENTVKNYKYMEAGQ